ncbi:hypothetical protein ACFLXO_05110 [Chloroflexota bacterium]
MVIATFRGKHNWSKVRVLYILYSCQDWSCHSLTASQLQQYTGLSKDATYAVLGRLSKWNYILKHYNDGRYYYRLAARGERFLNYVPGSVLYALQPELQANVDGAG